MTWNHRVEDVGGWLRIIEVYYDEAGGITAWTDAIKPGGETLEELATELEQMRTALILPVLTGQDLKTGLGL